jgi:hypothetical protein
VYVLRDTTSAQAPPDVTGDLEELLADMWIDDISKDLMVNLVVKGTLLIPRRCSLKYTTTARHTRAESRLCICGVAPPGDKELN